MTTARTRLWVGEVAVLCRESMARQRMPRQRMRRQQAGQHQGRQRRLRCRHHRRRPRRTNSSHLSCQPEHPLADARGCSENGCRGGGRTPAFHRARRPPIGLRAPSTRGPTSGGTSWDLFAARTLSSVPLHLGVRATRISLRSRFSYLGGERPGAHGEFGRSLLKNRSKVSA